MTGSRTRRAHIEAPRGGQGIEKQPLDERFNASTPPLRRPKRCFNRQRSQQSHRQFLSAGRVPVPYKWDTPPRIQISINPRNLTVPKVRPKPSPQSAVTGTTFGTVRGWTLGMCVFQRQNRTSPGSWTPSRPPASTRDISLSTKNPEPPRTGRPGGGAAAAMLGGEEFPCAKLLPRQA